MNRRLALPLLALLATPALARAEGPTAAGRAEVEADLAESKAALDKKYAGKSDNESKRERQKEQVEAERAVFEKRGVDRREWEHSSTRRSPKDVAEAEQRSKELVAKRAKDRADAESAKTAPKGADADETQVVRGFDEQNPAHFEKKAKLDADGNPVPTIEVGEDKLKEEADPDAP